MRDYELAALAYNTYCKAVGREVGTTNVPAFERLPEIMQDAWWTVGRRLEQEFIIREEEKQKND